MNYPEITVTDMHTGGEPLRIIRNGYPPVPGDTILEKRRHAARHLDHLRRLLMHEPRGHGAMYGAVLVSPTRADADIAVLFMHNAGYSTMCGHAMIALGRYAVDAGLVERQDPITPIGVECPCGLVRVDYDVRTDGCAFISVPSFPTLLDGDTVLADGRRVSFDIGYGGAFYALVVDRELGVDVHDDSVRTLTEAAVALTRHVKAHYEITHPDSADLAFLYGTIITDDRLAAGRPTRNICVFADAQVDRSPTGSGVTTRMAVAYARGQIGIGEERTFESITGSRFTAHIVGPADTGATRNAVRVRISGQAFYTGDATFRHEAADTLGRGFLCS